MSFDKNWYGDTEHARGEADCGPSEFSWGPGLNPPGKESAPPKEGGLYRGTTPRTGRRSARDRHLTRLYVKESTHCNCNV